MFRLSKRTRENVGGRNRVLSVSHALRIIQAYVTSTVSNDFILLNNRD